MRPPNKPGGIAKLELTVVTDTDVIESIRSTEKRIFLNYRPDYSLVPARVEKKVQCKRCGELTVQERLSAHLREKYAQLTDLTQTYE